MWDDVITLLSITEEANNIGDIVETITRKEVFAQIRSIGMKEKYEALSVGLKPQYTFILADYYDYDGQESIEYDGERFKVLRTYRKDTNELEIVVTR